MIRGFRPTPPNGSANRTIMGKKTDPLTAVSTEIPAPVNIVTKAEAPVPTAAPAADKAPKKVVAKKAAAKKPAVKKKPAAKRAKLSTDEIALRAYFISEHRQQHGLHGDSHSDWVQAERQLKAEARKKG
jgi:hypothetical protein